MSYLTEAQIIALAIGASLNIDNGGSSPIPSTKTSQVFQPVLGTNVIVITPVGGGMAPINIDPTYVGKLQP